MLLIDLLLKSRRKNWLQALVSESKICLQNILKLENPGNRPFKFPFPHVCFYWYFSVFFCLLFCLNISRFFLKISWTDPLNPLSRSARPPRQKLNKILPELPQNWKRNFKVFVENNFEKMALSSQLSILQNIQLYRTIHNTHIMYGKPQKKFFY